MRELTYRASPTDSSSLCLLSLRTLPNGGHGGRGLGMISGDAGNLNRVVVRAALEFLSGEA